jgi:hypothetical protein
MNWKAWSPVSGAVAKPGSPVAVVRSNSLFVANSEGEIITTILNSGRWTSVSQGSALPGSYVAAIVWGERIAVFTTATNGEIFATGGTPDGGWGPWASVSEGQTLAGSPLTVTPLGERFGLYVTDPNGGVYATGGTPDAPFGQWVTVSQGSAPAGSQVAAMPHGKLIDLFITDSNGGIYTTEGTPDASWEPWQYVAPRNHSVPKFSAAPGSPVCVANPLGQQLVVADINGRIAATQGGAFGSGADWLPWVRIGELSVPLKAPVTAFTAFPTTMLFVIDTLGAVNAAIMPELGVSDFDYEHVQWSSLPEVNAVPGSLVTAVATPDAIGATLFITDANGRILTTSPV